MCEGFRTSVQYSDSSLGCIGPGRVYEPRREDFSEEQTTSAELERPFFSVALFPLPETRVLDRMSQLEIPAVPAAGPVTRQRIID